MLAQRAAVKKSNYLCATCGWGGMKCQELGREIMRTIKLPISSNGTA
jgi:hypothetical protein